MTVSSYIITDASISLSVVPVVTLSDGPETRLKKKNGNGGGESSMSSSSLVLYAPLRGSYILSLQTVS